MLKSFLLNFPPPKYIDVPYTGIVFSDNSIRILSLDKKNKHPIFFTEIPLEAGIIESGKIKNEEALGKILSEKRSEFSSPFVKFSVPDETTYIFTAKIPVVPGKDAHESVSFILEENVPLPLADISFDFVVQKIEESQGAEAVGYSAKVVVIAASTSLITSYVNILRKAGLEPLLCLNESQATAYAVVPQNSPSVSAIVHVHKQSAGIYIANGNFIEFSSIVPISSALSFEDTIKSIKAEVEKAVEYWSTKLEVGVREEKVLPVFLCGENEILKDLSEQIALLNNTSPSIANVWTNTFSIEDYVPILSFDESLRFAGAIGLFVGY